MPLLGTGCETWTDADIYEYGTQLEPDLRHSMCYAVRDISKLWAEQACARDDYALARRCLARYERCHDALLRWRCDGCRICAYTNVRTSAPAAAPTTMG